MHTTEQRRRWSVAAASVALAVAFQAGPASLARADAGDPAPVITYGFGLTEQSPATWDPTTNTLVADVHTDAVKDDAGQAHTIRVILPTGYFQNPQRRYPVFYLLHENLGDTATDAQYIPKAYSDMIIVLPDGGPRGWYTNWANQNTVAGAQNWETFHIDQVIPFIDANFRTVATKQGRAIGGMSMGGLGAFHYAQYHPELFSHLASFSGALDLTQLSAQTIIINSETSASQTILPIGPAEPSVPVGSIFGEGLDPWVLPGTPWYAASPTDNMNRLAGQHISVDMYVGKGALTLDVSKYDLMFEWNVHGYNMNAASALAAAGVPYTLTDYDAGQWGPTCDGGHNLTCTEQDMVDYLPKLEAAFAADGV
ncbi:alpha/beta hydrolase [Catenulispora subtropica]|uniref:Acyl-CoA:diacylglycerol acyltransferase n=1 Tax=Catenulispora subtropica TaxID=450798 RepID=A0ABP5BRF4_9ACTN